MSKYRKTIWALIILNMLVLMGGTGLYLRHRKLQQADQQFLLKADKFADGIASEGGASKKQVLKGMLLDHRFTKSRSISDADLDELLKTIRTNFASDRSGNSLLDFGFGFLFMKSSPPNQKEKVGRLCIDVANNATRDESKLFALAIISNSQIYCVKNELLPLTKNKNKRIAKNARLIIERFTMSKGIL